jgi:hypothetical protein
MSAAKSKAFVLGARCARAAANIEAILSASDRPCLKKVAASIGGLTIGMLDEAFYLKLNLRRGN